MTVNPWKTRDIITNDYDELGITIRRDVTSHPVEVKAKKNDTGKLDYTLLPLSGLESVVQALEFGAKKYGAFNYKAKGFTTRRLCAATLRHVLAYLKGEDNDPESGLSHLAHAGASILMLLEKIQDKSLDADDRYSKGA